MMKIHFKILILCILIAGCSPQKRMARLVDRHPELVTVDTVLFQKEVIIPERAAVMTIPEKRFYQELSEKRTVTLKDTATGITVNIAATVAPDSTHAETITITAIVPADTIFINEKIPVQTIVIQPSRKYYVCLLYVFLVFVAVILFFKKIL
jgi:hypothetical protein